MNFKKIDPKSILLIDGTEFDLLDGLLQDNWFLIFALVPLFVSLKE